MILKEIPRFARNDNRCHSERSEESRLLRCFVSVAFLRGVTYQSAFQASQCRRQDADATSAFCVASAGRRR
ncbi:MAG: hypothetical protein NZM28_01160, partial [Fimbriimonadales bacterium]|nr:hypothetical protein [Fimbriimonadales bacterium]